MKKLIATGAEAKIYQNKDKILKQRVSKGYRIEEIDKKLRKHRTKREATVYRHLQEHGFVPKLLSTDKKENLEIEFIKGDKIRDVLEKEDYVDLSKRIGKKIKKMHDLGIIHGDLTTSNMIYSNKKIFFIDFGLSFFSQKIEDKAVDLHLLRHALESKHYTIYKECFKQVLKSYKDKEVINHLEKVESRGRNKGKH